MTKLEYISRVSDCTASDVVRSAEGWMKFLNTAAKFYKYPFEDQLLIYAQRPDATACASAEIWRTKMRCWINRGAKGIALMDKQASNKLRYVFDVSDVHKVTGGRDPNLWKFGKEHTAAVLTALHQRYGNLDSNAMFPGQIMKLSRQIALEYQKEILQKIESKKARSSLEKIDAQVLNSSLVDLLQSSMAYTILVRCGIHPEEYRDTLNFDLISSFDTVPSLSILGNYTADLCKPVLMEIGKAIQKNQEKNLQKSLANSSDMRYNALKRESETGNIERTGEHGKNGDHVSQSGGHLPSESHEGREGGRIDEVRAEKAAVSDGAPENRLLNSDADRQGDGASTGSTGTGRTANGNPDRTDDEGAGSDRGTQSTRSNEMGGDGEQHPAHSGGNREQGTHLFGGKPGIIESKTVKAEEKTSSAFSISQEDMDSVLKSGSGFENGKYRIYHHFQKREDSKTNIDFLKKEYGTGGGSHIFPDGFRGDTWHDFKGISISRNGSALSNPDLWLRWTKVEKRLRELIGNDNYLTEEEKERYPDYLESISAPQYEIDAERKIARQRYINAHSELSPAEKRDTLAFRLSDFIRDLDGYEKRLLENVERPDLADMTAEEMEHQLADPATTQQLIDFLELVQRKTTSVYSRSNAWRFRQELDELHPMRYQYQTGDIVLIDRAKYEISELSADSVSVRNVDFPLSQKQFNRSEFEEKLGEHPENDRLKAVFMENQVSDEQAENPSDSIIFSIGSSEHPVFYNKDGSDRFTDLSFALGNKLLGILDEKQNREREDKNKHVGWYKKTDFQISVVINGQTFDYDGRFDIGDGEGDLLAHIKNFYEYSLSPNCPFIPEWKRKGEDYYKDQMETLHWGHDVLIPFLEQHTELTPEDEKLLEEILATEPDWFRKTVVKADQQGEKQPGYADVPNFMDDYNAVKERYPQNIVLYQVGDFFEMLGPDARIASTLLELHMTTRSLSDIGRVAMCGFPVHGLNQNIEKLRKEYGVTVSVIDSVSRNRIVYFMEAYPKDREQIFYPSGNKVPAQDTPDEVEQSDAEIPEPVRNDSIENTETTDNFSDIDPAAVRDALAQNGIVDGKVVDPGALRHNPFIQQVEKDVEQFAKDSESEREEREKSGHLTQETRDGDEAHTAKPTYQVGDTVYLEDTAFLVEQIGDYEVELRDPTLAYPIFRSEKKENLDNLLWSDARNTKYLPDAKVITQRPNYEVTVSVSDAPTLEKRMREAGVSTAQFVHDNGSVTFSFVENDRDIVNNMIADLRLGDAPDTKTEPVKLRQIVIDLTPRTDVSSRIPEENLSSPEPQSRNFHITDEHLGEGGAKIKFQNNLAAIRTLQEIEFDERSATPEEQEILSHYVGWGSLPQAFDENNAAWADEFKELYALLSPQEYQAARATTLNAHYTSPTVIKAMYQ